MSKTKMMDEKIIKRSFNLAEMRTADEGHVIEGHPAVYNQKTNIGNYFYEVIERGAFDGCNFDDVLFCVNHNLNKVPLARSRRNNGSSTMHVTTDDKGLHMRAELDVENNVEAKTVYSAVQRGDIDGMSFIFRIDAQEWEDLESDMPTRRIKKISRVMEVSAVTFPAYQGTDIDARDKNALDNAKMALENARSKELDNSNSEFEVLQLRNQILMKMEE